MGSGWLGWDSPMCVKQMGPHYSDNIMGAMASQITRLTIVYSTVYWGWDQRKHQSSASLAFVWGIHRRVVNSPHKWPITRKMFPFDDVITCSSVAVGSIFLSGIVITWNMLVSKAWTTITDPHVMHQDKCCRLNEKFNWWSLFDHFRYHQQTPQSVSNRCETDAVFDYTRSSVQFEIVRKSNLGIYKTTPVKWMHCNDIKMADSDRQLWVVFLGKGCYKGN